jgi:glycosyltransferase involved in cell wall biosynthesis
MPTVNQPGPCRILYFVNVGWFFLSHRLPLARAARASGYEVHVACSVDDPAEAERIRAEGFIVHVLRGARGARTLGESWRLARDLNALLSRLRPQILHNVTLRQVLLGGALARIRGVPTCVCALTGLGFVFTDPDRHRWARHAVCRLLGWVTAGRGAVLLLQNHDDRGLLERLGAVRPGRSIVIQGSGVDVDAFSVRPQPAGEPWVVLPARLLRDKGIDEFCAAAAELRRRGCSIRFAIAGGLDPRNPSAYTEADINGLARSSGVELWGHRPDMQVVYQHAAVVCLPSYREGFPKVLREAAAIGRAIVTTDVPGCRDAVEPGRTGLLVPARDSAALADAIASLAGDELLRARMGEAGARRVRERFSERHVIEQTLALYDRMRRGAGPGP